MASDEKHRSPAGKLDSRATSSCPAPEGIAKARRSRWPTRNQAKLKAYLDAGHHLVYDADRKRRGLTPFRAKSLTQVAAETRISATNVTYWLKQEHYDLWLRWWAGIGWAWDKIEAEQCKLSGK